MVDRQDSVTVTTHENWFQRVFKSIIGVLFGIFLVLATIGALFWNEGRAVQTAKSLAEGRAAVVSASSQTVDPANEGRLVHLTGDAVTSEPVADPLFGISAEGIRLVRGVEMYQWEEERRSETRDTLGGGQETVTTYTYSRGWNDGRIDSSDFHSPSGHENPDLPFESDSFQVPSAQFGAYTLGQTTLDAVPGSQELRVRPDQEEAIIAAYGGSERTVHVAGGRIVIGGNPERPVVGDVRVTYSIVPAGPLSIVAMQTGDTLARFQTAAGDAIQLVETGTVPADEMFTNAETQNIILTWIIRLVGLFLMFIGFVLITNPLPTIASVVPFLGSIVGIGTALVAVTATMVLGGGTIALAWLFYRPLVGLAVAAVFALATFGLVRLGRNRAKARAASIAPA